MIEGYSETDHGTMGNLNQLNQSDRNETPRTDVEFSSDYANFEPNFGDKIIVYWPDDDRN